jgi:8-oxo-dGTP pyrophosphatase MutT (NUDIX family)
MSHIHEKIDFTASVFIVHEGKVLLHLHKKLNRWLQPGGHIELDEGPLEAAIREVKEETGLDVELVGNAQLPGLTNEKEDIVPPKYLNRHNFNDTHQHIDFTYFGRVIGGTLQPEDGVEMRWLTREEVMQADILATTREYCLAALEELS